MDAAKMKVMGLKPLIFSVAAVMAIEMASILVISQTRYAPLLILGASRCLQIIAMLLIVSALGKGLSPVGLAPSRIGYGVKKGLIWSACFGIVTAVVSALIFVFGLNPLRLIQARLPSESIELVMFLFVGGFVGPIAEEILFRGILYGFFRRWGMGTALILSTLFFVSAHPGFSGIPLPQIAGSIVFALAYEMEGSLTAPITIHVLGNMAIFSIAFIARQPP